MVHQGQRQSPEDRGPSMTPLMDYHVKHLLGLMEGHDELRDSISLIRDSLKIMMAGGKSTLPLWHIRRLKRLVPSSPEIEEAADMLYDCIYYKDTPL